MKNVTQGIDEVEKVSLPPIQPRTPEERIEHLEKKLKRYEENGPAKLFYSLNRKMNEMAEVMNKHDLTSMDLTSKDDKTFDRLKSIWSDAESVAEAAKTIGDIAKVTGDEVADVKKTPFVINPEERD